VHRYCAALVEYTRSVGLDDRGLGWHIKTFAHNTDDSRGFDVDQGGLDESALEKGKPDHNGARDLEHIDVPFPVSSQRDGLHLALIESWGTVYQLG
jgi:hypothetical protein